MAGVDRGDVKRALKKKRFLEQPKTKHDIWWYRRGDPLQVTRAFVLMSRGKGNETFGNDNINRMKGSLGLDSMPQTRDFLLCYMQVPQYERIAGPGFGWQNIPAP